MKTLLGAGVLAAAALLTPAAALACGGFFCSSTPVDQEAERILFVQEDAQTVRSIVEIQYQGDPASFAWVVPVPAVPELDTFYASAFNALDLATQPQFVLPDECQFFANAAGAPSAGGGVDDAEGGGVTVLDRKVVGPFDTATIESDDPRALVEWLRENEFRIPAAMEPFIALYTAEHLKFVAMKLLPGEGTDAIKPISMRYQAANPAVPLRLTSIAALLEMGVKVWVLGDGRFGPANVPEIQIADNEIHFDLNNYGSNYVPLVARKVDALRGPGFVTELAGPTADLAQTIRSGFVPPGAAQDAVDGQNALADLLEKYPYITRLYTRVSPEEMFIDPIFARTAGGDVSNVHTLSFSNVEHCADYGGGGGGVPQGAAPGADADAGAPDSADAGAVDSLTAQENAACEFQACGASGKCALAADQNNGPSIGCACADGTLARAMVDTTSPSGIRVACGDIRMNFTDTSLPGTDNPFADPCAGFSCGDHGECVSLNGSPSCRCEQGLIAVASLDYTTANPVAKTTCVAPAKAIDPEFYAQTAVPEPQLPYPGRTTPLGTPAFPHDPVGRMTASSSDDGGCSTSGRPVGLPLGLSTLLLAPVLLRRRLSARSKR